MNEQLEQFSSYREYNSDADTEFACRDFDNNLWASPDEFGFREYPNLGKCVRLWWDE